MRFVIVTGMSGAGKRTVMKMLEDSGYFCVDNLPVPMVRKFYELMRNSMGDIENVALGIDIRNGEALEEMEGILSFFNATKNKVEILYMEASDNVLIKRFKETRRLHPLFQQGRVEEGLKEERKRLKFLKSKADYIIETDNLLVRDLHAEIEKIFVDNKAYSNLFVNVVSFGFKHGIPVDSDLVFDVRFMPNPYYEEALRPKTGNDVEVQNYVMDSEASVEFVDKLTSMIKFLIPNYIAEGKNQLVIGIGCTGGHHRSVTVANKLFDALKEDGSVSVKICHRDIKK
ncbi:MAG: RNase adapter RapZ [Lachnospiraceae bacterium]|nr:RNase adapter RapZ [Lachnospiraceae bacterium]